MDTRLLCLSLFPRICLNSCPLSVMLSNHFTHPLSSSPFALNLTQHWVLFQWVSSLHQVAKVLEPQLQHQSFQWIFRLGFLQDWLVWSYSPQDSQESSPTPQFKSINSSVFSFLSSPTLTTIHDYWKNHSFVYRDLDWQSDIFAFNILSRFVISFHQKNKCLLILWLQSLPTVILELKKIKSVTISTFPLLFDMKRLGLDAMILVFWKLSFKLGFLLSSLSSSRGSLVPLGFLPLEWCHLHIWGCWYFSWQSWFQLVIHLVQHFAQLP